MLFCRIRSSSYLEGGYIQRIALRKDENQILPLFQVPIQLIMSLKYVFKECI